MSSKVRIWLALLCLLSLAGLIGWGRFQASRTDVGGGHALAANIQNCAQCHQQVQREWESSAHARSFTNPQVQGAFQHFGHDRKCQSCHAPEPVLVTGLAVPPVLRPTDQKSGVNCLTCHALKDGQGVAARRTVADAPCRPIASPELTSGQACANCHVAIHKDWTESRYRTEGKNCQSCHMRTSPDRPGGVSHACLGGHDDALVRSGVKMASRQAGQELIVTVTNHATGHNFPGERHNRVLLVQVIEKNAAGEITLAQQQLIKGITPFRGESSAEKIKADEVFEGRFPVVEAPVTAQVRLLYKTFPWISDREALVVHEETVEFTTP